MSSPRLNNLITLGCILCYLSTIFFGLDGRYLTHAVATKMCFVSIGISLLKIPKKLPLYYR